MKLHEIGMRSALVAYRCTNRCSGCATIRGTATTFLHARCICSEGMCNIAFTPLHFPCSEFGRRMFYILLPLHLFRGAKPARDGRIMFYILLPCISRAPNSAKAPCMQSSTEPCLKPPYKKGERTRWDISHDQYGNVVREGGGSDD